MSMSQYGAGRPTPARLPSLLDQAKRSRASRSSAPPNRLRLDPAAQSTRSKIAENLAKEAVMASASKDDGQKRSAPNEPQIAADAEYKVGPGRPPKEHQFKPGVSGNRKGRKKKPT